MEKEGESVLPGPSAGVVTLPALNSPTKAPVGQDPSEDSSDETDPSSFSFALVQPYLQAVKQAIGWEGPQGVRVLEELKISSEKHPST